MQVVAGTIGTAHRFGGVATAAEQDPDIPADGDISIQEFTSALSPPVKDLLMKSISLNSTAFEGDVDGQLAFIGSKTETSLLIFAKEHLAMGPVSEERANAKVLHVIPFDSGRKCMGIAVQLENGKARLYIKGASEIMLEKCTQILRDPSKNITAAPLTEDNRETIKGLIETYARASLRTIGIIYRDFDRWPPRIWYLKICANTWSLSAWLVSRIPSAPVFQRLSSNVRELVSLSAWLRGITYLPRRPLLGTAVSFSPTA
jgi:P-type Ca2+ transporter type 2C